MEAPAITRQRRPFLAPLWIMVLLGVSFIAGAAILYRADMTTTIVIARHAEKALGTIDDPPLSMDGEQRAQTLARMFGDPSGPGRIDAVYVTEARRTQQTAAPLLDRLRMQPKVVSALDVKGTAERILEEHRGGRVLVIAHSNTIPPLVHALSGIRVPPMTEEEYERLYIVSVPRLGNPGVLKLTY